MIMFQSAVQITGSLKAEVRAALAGIDRFQSAVQITGSLKEVLARWLMPLYGVFQSAVQITGSLKTTTTTARHTYCIVSICRADHWLPEGAFICAAWDARIQFQSAVQITGSLKGEPRSVQRTPYM